MRSGKEKQGDGKVRNRRGNINMKIRVVGRVYGEMYKEREGGDLGGN